MPTRVGSISVNKLLLVFEARARRVAERVPATAVVPLEQLLDVAANRPPPMPHSRRSCWWKYSASASADSTPRPCRNR